MAASRSNPNDEFIKDGLAIIKLGKRKALGELIESLVGTHDTRTLAYREFYPFCEDFERYFNGAAEKESEILGNIIKSLKAERITWALSPLLAWLSVYHKADAKSFYSVSGLAETRGAIFRSYIGVPGDRARVRKGLKPRGQVSETADTNNHTPQERAVIYNVGEYRDLSGKYAFDLPISIIPNKGLSAVHGCSNDEPGRSFLFNTSFLFGSESNRITLLGLSIDYVDADGAYCLNLGPFIRVAGKAIEYLDNCFDLVTPVMIDRQLVQIEYRRTAQPPLMTQRPTDCNWGYAHMSFRYLRSGHEVTEDRFFKFTTSMSLQSVDSLPEPPILSDSQLAKMLDDRIISQRTFVRANEIRAIDRYRIVKFPRHDNVCYINGYKQVSANYRKFIVSLWRRYVTRWEP